MRRHRDGEVSLGAVAHLVRCIVVPRGVCRGNITDEVDEMDSSNTAAPFCNTFFRITAVDDPVTLTSWGCEASPTTYTVLAQINGGATCE